MRYSGVREIGLNVLLGVVAKGGALLSTIIIAPIAINAVGTERFGAYVSLLSILTWIGLFDFGIGNAVQNALVSARHEENNAVHCALVRFLWGRTTLIGGFLAIGLAAAAFTSLPHLLAGRRASIDSAELRSTFLAVGASLLVNWLVTPIRTILTSHRRTHLWNVYGITSSVLYIGLVACFRRTIDRIDILANCYLISAVTGATLLLVVAGKTAFKIRADFGVSKLERATIVSLFQTSGAFFAIQVIGIFMYQADIVLVSNLASATEAAKYYMAQRVALVPIVLWLLVLQPVWPAMSHIWASKGYDQVRRRMARISIAGAAAGAAIGIAFQLAYPLASHYLNPDGIGVTRNVVLAASILAALRMWVDTWATANNAIGALSTQVATAVVQGVAFTASAVYLIQHLGAIGAIWAHVLALLIAPAWLLPWRITRESRSAIKCATISPSPT